MDEVASGTELAEDLGVEAGRRRIERCQEDAFADVEMEVVKDDVARRHRQLRHLVGHQLVDVGAVAVGGGVVRSAAGCRTLVLDVGEAEVASVAAPGQLPQRAVLLRLVAAAQIRKRLLEKSQM